jgi:hypothetical protein
LVLFLICLMILKFLVPFSIALNYLMIVIPIHPCGSYSSEVFLGRLSCCLASVCVSHIPWTLYVGPLRGLGWKCFFPEQMCVCFYQVPRYPSNLIQF